MEIVPMKFHGKCKNLLAFSGLQLNSAVYDLRFKKCALALQVAFQQFITDHGILVVLISDGNQAKNFSAKWVQLCSKYTIMQSCSEPYKQNQNYVEHLIMEANMAVSQ